MNKDDSSTTRNEPFGNPTRLFFVIIMLAGTLFRLALIAQRGAEMDDPDNYLPMAKSVADGKGLTINGRLTAYRPPLYPLLLAPLVGYFERDWQVAVAGLHLLLGLGTIALTGSAAKNWGLQERGCLLASFLVAFDPVLAVQARSVMTETLAAFLVSLSLAASSQKRVLTSKILPILAGLSFGLGSLCRPSLLPGACLVIVANLVTSRSWKLAARLTLGVVLALAPWAIRNDRVIGSPVFTTTHGGYTLALANNPAYYADVLHGPANAVWSGPNQQSWWDGLNLRTAGMTEPQADKFLRDEAIGLALDRPWDFFRATLARLSRFWGLAPSREVYSRSLRLVTTLWTAPFWVFVVLGLCRRSSWKWPKITASCIIFGLTIVHAFFWTDLRMRAPIVPALAVLAACAIAPIRGIGATNSPMSTA